MANTKQFSNLFANHLEEICQYHISFFPQFLIRKDSIPGNFSHLFLPVIYTVRYDFSIAAKKKAPAFSAVSIESDSVSLNVLLGEFDH